MIVKKWFCVRFNCTSNFSLIVRTFIKSIPKIPLIHFRTEACKQQPTLYPALGVCQCVSAYTVHNDLSYKELIQ